MPLLEQGLVDKQVRPVLEVLLQDKDRDVKYFAGHALSRTSCALCEQSPGTLTHITHQSWTHTLRHTGSP